MRLARRFSCCAPGPALGLVALLTLSAGGGQRGDPLEGLRAKLRASDKWTRAKAVEELARTGSQPAWELVFEALADPKGEVADTAELVLAELEGEHALELLEGECGVRSKEALVRARAVELCGRLSRIPVEDRLVKRLERALGDAEPEVRRMAAWSLERLARAQKLDEAAREAVAEGLARRARSERDPLVRTRALAALVAIDPAGGRRAWEAARGDDDALLRGASAALVARLFEAGEALARLAPLASDSEASVRRVAVESLAELGTPEALAALVARLSAEPEERLLLRLVEHLQRLSGRKYRRDPRPWSDWLRTLPADWKATPSGAVPAEDPAEATRVALAGLPIVSKRVTILIDLSGSIWNVRADGRTRKQVIDAKLREALEALPADTRFNLIPYTGAPIPWKSRLTPATPARVREATAWFEARHENGSGNFWDAALLALEDPEVDTLIVLFDGAPTGGSRHRLELIVPLFLERNLARRVAVDLVLVDASRKLQRMWGELAEGTGGRMIAVSF